MVPQYGKKESFQPFPDRDADDWCQVNVKWEHPSLYFLPYSITEIVRAPHLAWITSYYSNRFVGFPRLSIEVWYDDHPIPILYLINKQFCSIPKHRPAFRWDVLFIALYSTVLDCAPGPLSL